VAAGGTGVRELTRGLATLRQRWIQEPLMVRDRDGNPQKDPLSVHCFCGCSESALLGLGHHFQDQKVKGQGYRGRGMFGGLPHSLLTFIRPRKYFCTDLILDDGPYLNL